MLIKYIKLFIIRFYLLGLGLNIQASQCENLLKKITIEINVLDLKKISSLKRAFSDLGSLTQEKEFPFPSIETNNNETNNIFKNMRTADEYLSFLKTFNYKDNNINFNKYIIFLDTYKFSEKNIVVQQQKELSRILFEHGLSKTNIPYKELEKQSYRNVIFFIKKYLKETLNLNYEELLVKNKLINTEDFFKLFINKIKNKKSKNIFKDLFNLVNQVNIEYKHNAHIEPSKDSKYLPFMSSDVLSSLKIGKGFNSKGYFTNIFLKSSNNIFFSVNPYFEKQSSSAVSEYGNIAYKINYEYAKEKGIISIDLMYPSESFKMFIKKYLSNNINKELREKLTNALFKKEKVDKLNLTEKNMLKSAKNMLYRLDFTVKDFEELIKTLLLIKIFNNIQKQNHVEINKMKIDIKNDTYWFVKENIFINIFGISNFELKIPVMVPNKKIEIQN